MKRKFERVALKRVGVERNGKKKEKGEKVGKSTRKREIGIVNFFNFMGTFWGFLGFPV